MRVVFRADASPSLGGGHIMRTLALADRLHAAGCACQFLVNQEALLVVPALQCSNHQVIAVTDVNNVIGTARALTQTRADALVIDHYGIGARDEALFRQIAKRLIVIDDLSDRPHHCDLFLNQNLGADRRTYAALLSDDCEILLGPDYALLRPEFANSRTAALAKRDRWDGCARRVLLSLGLTDLGGHSQRLAEVLLEPQFGLDALDVVTGAAAASMPWLLEMAQSDARLSVGANATDMAERMTAADVAVGAVGSTSWERCVLGLPTLGAVLADNQILPAEALAAAGAIVPLGDLRELTTSELRTTLERAFGNPEKLKRVGQAASRVCDGRGADRVAQSIVNLGPRGRSW